MDIYERIDSDASLSELRKKLEAVPDSYSNFVLGTIALCIKRKGYKDRLIDYMEKHPKAISDEIIENVG